MVIVFLFAAWLVWRGNELTDVRELDEPTERVGRSPRIRSM
ncbi:hypothetical protein [Phytohabitans kaempferiae]|uniref:Uncharacterized protein n=1 Tax=Phytohabitans kaempferiae TaxID=1620943 RepID=A0ABV6MBC9_9ACTN